MPSINLLFHLELSFASSEFEVQPEFRSSAKCHSDKKQSFLLSFALPSWYQMVNGQLVIFIIPLPFISYVEAGFGSWRPTMWILFMICHTVSTLMHNDRFNVLLWRCANVGKFLFAFRRWYTGALRQTYWKMNELILSRLKWITLTVWNNITT